MKLVFHIYRAERPRGCIFNDKNVVGAQFGYRYVRVLDTDRTGIDCYARQPQYRLRKLAEEGFDGDIDDVGKFRLAFWGAPLPQVTPALSQAPAPGIGWQGLRSTSRWSRGSAAGS